jgi:RNA polymerase sigma-70 factor (ECF subfamily)
METLPPTDAQLAAQAHEAGPAGQAALSVLLSRHARRLHRHFSLEFHDEELATDLVQEVFERVIRARERVPADEGFRPWLWTIALNLARSEWRRRAARPATLSLDHPEQPEESPLGERLADPAPTPRRSATASERTRRLLAAIHRLDEAHREVILLKYHQDLPCAEVARILNISEGTVWSRTARALARLRELLGPDANPATGDVP